MKLIPIDTRDIPPEVRKKRETLPKRTYEAAIITFLNGKHNAVRIEEPYVSKKGLYVSFKASIEYNHFPCDVIQRDGNVYLIKTY